MKAWYNLFNSSSASVLVNSFNPVKDRYRCEGLDHAKYKLLLDVLMIFLQLRSLNTKKLYISKGDDKNTIKAPKIPLHDMSCRFR